MSMHRARRTGLVLCAIALLLAGCSGSSAPAGSSPAVPRGLGGPGGKHHHAHQHKHHHGKPGKHHRHHGGSPSSSAAPSNRPTRSASPTQVHSSSPAQHTSSAPGGGHPHTSSPPTHHPPAGPRVAVTPHLSLRDGQTVTVEGWGFTPNTLLAVAECRDRGTQTNLSDCNINSVITYAPGKRVHSDGNGHVGPLQIVVAKTFKSVNCATQKCLVAISEPTLNPNPADEGDQYIKFQ